MSRWKPDVYACPSTRCARSDSGDPMPTCTVCGGLGAVDGRQLRAWNAAMAIAGHPVGCEICGHSMAYHAKSSGGYRPMICGRCTNVPGRRHHPAVMHRRKAGPCSWGPASLRAVDAVAERRKEKALKQLWLKGVP